MKSKHILLGSALATTLIFAGCQPQPRTETKTDTMMVEDDTLIPAGSGAMIATEDGVMVGGAMMLPSRPIAVNASDAQNLTTLVAAVKQAELVETLSGPGPFTVFAPTNAAFEKVPEATLQGLMTPEQKPQLTSLLTYHVVPGRLDSTMLTNGQKLKTVQGEELTVVVTNGTVMLRDAMGNTATVETADVEQSNGIVHIIDTVLMPKKL